MSKTAIRFSGMGFLLLAAACTSGAEEVATQLTSVTAAPETSVTAAPETSQTTLPQTLTAPTTTAETTSSTAPRPPVPVRDDDVLASIVPTPSTDSFDAALQCNGTQHRPGEQLFTGSDDQTTVGSIGRVLLNDQVAFRLTTTESDGTFAGGRRCEFAFLSEEQRLPRATVLWNSFVVQTNDWSGTDDQQIIAQWHDGDTDESKTPILAFYVSGSQLRVISRTDPTATPSNDTSVATTLHESAWPSDQWVRVVIKSLISHDPADDPFVRVWIDGRLVVDVTGPIGYNVQELDYAKVGFYHWSGNNPWDLSVPSRDVAVAEFSIVNDPDRRYVFDDISRFQEDRLASPITD